MGHDSAEQFALPFFLTLVLVLVTYMLGHLVEKFHIRFLTESGVALLAGLLVGMLDHFTGRTVVDRVHLSHLLFTFFLLPVIIFESSYSLRKAGLFHNFGIVMSLAILGTIVNTFVLGGIIYFISKSLGLGVLSTDNLSHSLILASILSAIDPVASLSILTEAFHLHNSTSAPPTLYSIVFGESVFNDAVSILLYDSMSDLADESSVEVGSIFGSLGMFFAIFALSLVLGCVFGMLAAFILRHVNLHESPHLELALILIFPYMSYFLAEVLHGSGIMTIFVCGLVLRHYAFYSVSRVVQISGAHFLKALGSFCEVFIFVLLGFAIWIYHESHIWSLGFIALTIVGCFVARACIVFPFCSLSNLVRKGDDKISFKMQVFMWYAGLRGAIAFALAVDFYETHGGNSKESEESAALMVTTTLMTVVFTVLIGGGLCYPVLHLLKLNKLPPARQSSADLLGESLIQHEHVDQSKKMKKRRFSRKFFDFESSLFGNWLRRDKKKTPTRVIFDIFGGGMVIQQEMPLASVIDAGIELEPAGRSRSLSITHV